MTVVYRILDIDVDLKKLHHTQQNTDGSQAFAVETDFIFFALITIVDPLRQEIKVPEEKLLRKEEEKLARVAEGRREKRVEVRKKAEKVPTAEEETKMLKCRLHSIQEVEDHPTDYFEIQLRSANLFESSRQLNEKLLVEERRNYCVIQKKNQTFEKESIGEINTKLIETKSYVGDVHYFNHVNEEAVKLISKAYKSALDNLVQFYIGALYHSIGIGYEAINDYLTSLLQYTEALRIIKLCWEQNTKASLQFMKSLFETSSCLGNEYYHLQNIHETLKDIKPKAI